MTAPLYAQEAKHFEHSFAALGNGELLATERVLKTAITPLDDFVGGFRPSRAVLIDSDARYASELLHVLCVCALSKFGEEVIWIDGGNVIDPYMLSALCKRRGIDRYEKLSMVNVARAFTAYQLTSLIDGFLDEEARRSAPSTIIISSISDMFMDKDLRRSEAHQLLGRCAREIERITKERGTITVVTSHTPRYVKPDPKMTSLLSSAFDVHMQIRCGRNGIGVSIPKEGRSTTFTPVPWSQMVLNDFMEGFYGKDRAYISSRA